MPRRPGPTTATGRELVRLRVARGGDPEAARARISALSPVDVRELRLAELQALAHRSDDEEGLLRLLAPVPAPAEPVAPEAVLRALWEAGILPEPRRCSSASPFALAFGLPLHLPSPEASPMEVRFLTPS
jgi:hypothetical protein